MKLKITKYLISGVILLIITTNWSCKKYLDAKPNINLEIPSTLADLQALLNNNNAMNNAYPALCEVASDDYYVPISVLNTQTTNIQGNYNWLASAFYEYDWDNQYERGILNANVVLDNIDKVPKSNVATYNEIKGSALFYRAIDFFYLAQEYAEPFNKNSANSGVGICLRVTSSITQKSVRANVSDTYAQIIQDLKQSAEILPDTAAFPTIPNKIAANALLAKVYLVMQDYQNALDYANSCLNSYSTLIDYNSLDSTVTYPLARFSSEVIFHSTSASQSILSVTNAHIDSNLYKSYQANDLRRSIYFKTKSGVTGFYGSYAGGNSSSFFDGIATDEIFLIRAECNARLGNISLAMSDLNKLLKTRWKGTFSPLSASDSNTALSLILTERRKELVFRGTRWSDLRRLNLDPNYAITLSRNINGQQYTLPPNDLRYTFLLPPDVIALGGIQQTPR